MDRAADISDAATHRDVDEERALEALRAAWGDAYAIGFDDMPGTGGARWQAWRLDGDRTRLAGSTPDELDAAIRADCTRGGPDVSSDWDEPLSALRWHWGEAYIINRIEVGRWIAERRDTHETLRDDTPLGLRDRIIADYTAHPVSRSCAP